MHTSGEKPGIGEYKCTTCGEIIVLNDDSDTLPPCPVCNETQFEEI